jgi:hypothetical protein
LFIATCLLFKIKLAKRAFFHTLVEPWKVRGGHPYSTGPGTWIYLCLKIINPAIPKPRSTRVEGSGIGRVEPSVVKCPILTISGSRKVGEYENLTSNIVPAGHPGKLCVYNPLGGMPRPPS